MFMVQKVAQVEVDVEDKYSNLPIVDTPQVGSLVTLLSSSPHRVYNNNACGKGVIVGTGLTYGHYGRKCFYIERHKPPTSLYRYRLG